MEWNQSFAARTKLMRRSAVRELLKFATQPEVISFAGGLPAAELFPVDEIRQAAERVLSERGPAVLQYGDTEGILPLRDWIARQYPASLGVRRENVMIVSGAQQGLDLIGRVFLNEGDRVLVENPTYLALLSAWRPLGVEFVPIAADEEGFQIEGIKAALSPHPKLIYSVPNFQNPSGATLSLARRQALVSLAEGHGVIVVEDDPYGALRYSGQALPSLLELAAGGPGGLENCPVVQVGTFSKVLSPGLRIGWIVAAEAVINRLGLAKQAMDLHTGTLSQWIVYETVSTGFLDTHVPHLRLQYRIRRDTMLAALDAHMPAGVTWTRPAGGMFLLVRLPESIQAREVLERCLANQVAFVPGEEFHLNGLGKHTMRLNFTNARPEYIGEGIRRLAQALRG